MAPSRGTQAQVAETGDGIFNETRSGPQMGWSFMSIRPLSLLLGGSPSPSVAAGNRETLLDEDYATTAADNDNDETARVEYHRIRSATIAACFLKDYEEGRSPTLHLETNGQGGNDSDEPSRTNAESSHRRHWTTAGISDRQLKFCRFKFSVGWKVLGLGLGTLFLFLGHLPNPGWTLALHAFAWIVFAVDFYLTQQLRSRQVRPPTSQQQDLNDDVTSKLHLEASWVETGEQEGTQHLNDLSRLERAIRKGMVVFLVLLFVESWATFFSSMSSTNENNGQGQQQEQDTASSSTPRTPPLVPQLLLATSGLMKPIVFFYMSRRARDALQALIRIVKKLVRVILIEFFLILAFAAVACRLYSSKNNNGDYADEKQHEYDYFQNLERSFLSMFALSTTVVNPSLWMPVYAASQWNALFFALFIVVAIFYLHSLVLSVIFQVFVLSAQTVHRQSSSDREHAMRMAFVALQEGSLFCMKQEGINTYNALGSTPSKIVVDPVLICETFQLLRPHYNKLKLKILMDLIILDHLHHPSEPSWHKERGWGGVRRDREVHGHYHFLDYAEFRSRVAEALNSSIRVSRAHTSLGMAVEVVSALVAVVNFLYIVLLTSQFEGRWFVKTEFVVGSIITLLALFEVLVRYNPLKVQHYPLTRLNVVLDGMALLGALVSLFGIGWFITGSDKGLELLFTGRAIGMIQSMRFSIWGREVLQRSMNVLPALTGPIILVITTMQVFVCIGMFLWQGAVDADEMAENENVGYLFWLNSFNSYTESLVTILNVMVINDWHQIANVFLYASRCSSPIVVYTFFISVVVVAVSVMLNLIVVFFCETFVSQLDLVDVGDNGGLPPYPPDLDSPSVETTSSTRSADLITKHVTPLAQSWIASMQFDSNDLKRKGTRTSACSDTGEEVEFDIIRREKYDDLVKAVANTADQQNEELAMNTRNALEMIVPEGGEVGYMLYCKNSPNEFPTQSFKRLISEFLLDQELRDLISEFNDHLFDDSMSTLSSYQAHPKCPIGPPTRQVRHSLDISKALDISLSILPHNHSVVLVTARVVRDQPRSQTKM